MTFEDGFRNRKFRLHKKKKKKVFFFFDSMNNFNVKFPLLLKMVLGIENLDYIKKKSVFLIIKQRIYLLTKEYCYKYCPLGTREKCLIAKYHTHILHK